MSFGLEADILQEDAPSSSTKMQASKEETLALAKIKAGRKKLVTENVPPSRKKILWHQQDHSKYGITPFFLAHLY